MLFRVFILGFFMGSILLSSHFNKYDNLLVNLSREMAYRIHYNPVPNNDKFYRNVVTSLFNKLDLNRRYFLEEEIQEFFKKSKQFYYLSIRGNFKYLNKIFDIYLQRGDLMKEYVAKFSLKELFYPQNSKLIIRKETDTWNNSLKSLKEYWKKVFTTRYISALVFAREQKNNSNEIVSEQKILEKTKKRFLRQLKREKYEKSFTKIKIFLDAFLNNLDRHSSYLSPQGSKDYEIRTKLKLTGIGATLRNDGDYIQVISISKGGPAYKDERLKPQDLIISVRDEGKEEVDLLGMDVGDAVQFIRGPKGKRVFLTILRGGKQGTQKIIDIVRDEISIEDSRAKGKIIQSGRYRIGFISVPSFYGEYNNSFFSLKRERTVSNDVKDIIENFQSQGGVDALIVDLRSNGGGLLKEAVNLTGLFIGKKDVVQTRYKNAQTENIRILTSTQKQVFFKPIFVLTSSISASASEIFVAAIQDHRRGIIVGDYQTHGKGTVQLPRPLNSAKFIKQEKGKSLGLLKFTIQKFYRISGETTQLNGVKSDIVLPGYLQHQKEIFEGYDKNALPADKITQVKRHFGTYFLKKRFLTNAINKLKKHSIQRIKTNPDYRELIKDITLFKKEQVQEKFVYLNYDDFINKKKSMRDKLEKRSSYISVLLGYNFFKKEIPSQKKEKEKFKAKDLVFNETINIVNDYLTFF